MTDYIYDIETYPNCFTACFMNAGDPGSYWQFEISTRRNDVVEMLAFLWALAHNKHRMVGFNNEGFDYPVIHLIMQLDKRVTVNDIYNKAMNIIRNQDDRFTNIIWENDRFVEQVDLFKIHHFDNFAKSTSLKALQFNMRSQSLEDLPFPPGTILTPEQIDIVHKYNLHDVAETLEFYKHTLSAIRFREDLSKKYGRNFVNFNDTKIGKEHFITELEKARPGCCYDRSSGTRQVRQTHRARINLGEIILPYIHFNNPDLQRMHHWLAGQSITETNGVFKDLNVTAYGFEFNFGLGGIHGSVNNSIVNWGDGFHIIDLDVTSYYPSLAIVNKFYPEHLGETFCQIYSELKTERIKHKKGTAENAVLKLALNGTFGDSNNPYSVFYDPKFTMAITINGQLLLCMLAESLMTKINHIKLIQANTDGLTVCCRSTDLPALQEACNEWQSLTGMELERAEYTRMFIRDVNNYLAEKMDGSIKRKGAYCYETPLENPNTAELQWHQDHSARVIAKAAEAALLDGDDIAQYITTHAQPHDFMLRAKVPRTSRLMWGDKQIQNISRYYISTNGESLTKVMPPLAKKPDHERNISINKGWLTTICNNLDDVRLSANPINFDWYIKESEKLVRVLK